MDAPKLCLACGKLFSDAGLRELCPDCIPAQPPGNLGEFADVVAKVDASSQPNGSLTEVSSANEQPVGVAEAWTNQGESLLPETHEIGRRVSRKPLFAACFGVALALIFFAATGLFRHRHRADADARPVQPQPAESPDHLARRYVERGARLLDDGDNFGGLVWFVEALKVDRGIPDQEANDRVRIASVLRHSPKLVQLWCAGASLNGAEFSLDGRLVLAAASTNAVWIWNTQTGETQSSPIIHDGNRPIEAHFSPDAQTIVSVSGNSACLWSTRTGERLRTFAHPGASHATFNATGDLLATASSDGSVKIWSVGNSAAGARIEALCTLSHKKPLVSLCFSPDSNGLLTAEEAGSVHIWDISDRDSGPHPERLPAWKPEGALRYATFDLDGSRIVTLSTGGAARIWDATTGSAITPALRESTALTHATFSPDGGSLATTAEGHFARIWNVETGVQEAQLSGHKDAVTLSCFSPSGQKIITASVDGTARVFESASGKALTPALHHGAPVVAAQFHPDGQRFLTASADGTVRVWSLWTERQLLPFSDELGTRVIAITPDRTTAVVQDSAYSLQVWDAVSWKATSVLMSAGNLVTYASLTDDRKRLLSAAPTRGSNGFDFVIKTWDLPTGKEVSSIPTVGDFSLNPLVASYDCKRIAVRRGKAVEVLDASTAAPVFPAVNFSDRPALVRFSPDSRFLIVAGGCKLEAFDLATGKPAFSPLKHSCPLSDAVFSHDGKRILTACSDDSVSPGQAQLWDVLTGKAVGKAMKQAGGILHASFSSDDRMVVTASKDNTARLWDAATAQPIGSPLRHPATVSDSSLSVDGRWIATASHDKSARVWDVKTGEPLTPSLKHNQYVDEVMLLAGGHYLVTRSILKMKVWELASDSRSAGDLEALAQVLSARGCVRQNAGGDGGRGLAPLNPSTLAASSHQLRKKCADDFCFAEFNARNKIPARDSRADATLIDLTPHYNALLTEPRHAGASANDFAGLRQGLQTYGGTEFDVRGVVQLAGGDLLMHGGRPLPEAVQRIRVDQTFSRVHLLHGASFYEKDRTPVAYLRLHYEDGKVQQLPIFAGIDVDGATEWAREITLTHAELAWPRPGENAPRNRAQPARLYKSSWDNPFSDVPVKSIDYVSTLSRAAPYLVAITIEP